MSGGHYILERGNVLYWLPGQPVQVLEFIEDSNLSARKHLSSHVRDKPQSGYWRLALLMAAATAFMSLALIGCAREQSTESTPELSATGAPIDPAVRPTLPARLPEQPQLQSLAAVEIVGAGDENASLQRPAFLAAEITGRHLSNVSLIGGALSEDGRQRVLLYRPVDPDPGDDVWPGNWKDGVHEIIRSWDFAGDFIWDGQDGDFVVLWTTDPDADTRTVHGRFRAAGDDKYKDSVLVVNLISGTVEGVIETRSGARVGHEPGDEFQLTDLILAEDGALHSQPGLSLFFDDGGQLAFASRPAPSGSYFLGISAETARGEADAGFVNYSVNNDSLVAGYRTHLDLQRGFQVMYPEAWPAPDEQSGRLLFSDPSGSTQMGISSHPDMNDRPAIDLKNQALEAYGEVTVLYEDQVTIGESGALRTAYGYEASDGSRTGILLTFSQDGQAFIVDVDGPAADEAGLLALSSVVAESWASRPLAAVDDGQWAEAIVDGLPVTVPASALHTQLGNGWHRFAGSDEETFFALRSEVANERGLFTGMDHWLGVAGRGVSDFSSSPTYSHDHDEQSWARAEIEYTLGNGERIVGSIMVTKIDDQFLVLWAEGPEDAYELYEKQVVLTVIDEIGRIGTE